jgi:hypothetical protein
MRLSKLLIAILLTAASLGVRADPLPDSSEKEIVEAIEKNWNIPTGMTDIERYTVTLRVHLSASGAVTQVDVLDPKDDPNFRALANSAERAVILTQHELGRLPVPADQLPRTINLRWDMKAICEQLGGC